MNVPAPYPFDKSDPMQRLWTRDEYYRAGELGIFEPEERLELIGGEIYRRMPEGFLHAGIIDLVNTALVRAFAGQDCFVRQQHSLTLSDNTEPIPDLAVVRGSAWSYLRQKRHPVPSEVLLLVEVSHSTLTFDREIKAVRYAAAGIREFWIVNLQEGVLEVYRNPEAGFPKPTAVYRGGDTLAPLAAPGCVIAVADFLPSLEESAGVDTEGSKEQWAL